MNKILVISFFALLLTGCKGSFFESYQKVNPSGWDKDSLLAFNVEITDTLQAYNMYLNIRNQGSYEFSNLWLFVDIVAPDSTALRDTIEITLAQPDGTWLGKGTSGIYQLQLPYRKNIIFPYSGEYSITIEQAMRSEKLEGIQNIGIKIDKN